MSFWVLIQVLVNVILLASTVALWWRLNRPAKDDPRLSKGLQLLQTKISILEDLSDRTETQVSQLTALMEQKVRDIQSHLLQADKTMQKIEASQGKSLEVARIFQDRIPHQEIIERQNTIKYVKAARLAYQGLSADEIAKQVDLSRGELDFLTKVNRDQLQFSEEDLPEWAKAEPSLASSSSQTVEPQPLAKTTDQAQVTLSELGEKFRQAVQPAPVAPAVVKPRVTTTGVSEVANHSRGHQVEVKKIVFPKIDVNSNLG